ncbi:hypothetical protein D917_04572, partial [Trichinella nativa]
MFHVFQNTGIRSIRIIIFQYQFQANKPLMEKRRRARINRSLDELKSMLICSTKPSVN